MATVRFGEFEVDPDGWVLRRNGARVRLQRKPFQILRLLLREREKVVSRDALARELWPDLHVNYTRSLNTAMNALRQALGETTEAARWIETHAGVGYRFKGRVDGEREPQLAMGYYCVHRFSFETLSRARGLFLAAAAEPETAVRARAALALLPILEGLCGYEPVEKAARRALEHLHAYDTGGEGELARVLAEALRTDNHEAALAYCERPPELPSPGIPACFWQAEFALRAERFEEGVALMRRAEATEPASLLVHTRLAHALLRSGDAEAAMAQSWRALALEPVCAAAQQVLARAYARLGFLEDARTEWHNALRCSGEHPWIAAEMALALRELEHSPQDLSKQDLSKDVAGRARA